VNLARTQDGPLSLHASYLVFDGESGSAFGAISIIGFIGCGTDIGVLTLICLIKSGKRGTWYLSIELLGGKARLAGWDPDMR